MATTAYTSSYTGAQIDAAIGAVPNKQDTLVSGSNIKTINNESILGSGNISISGGSSISVITMKARWVSQGTLGNFTFDEPSTAYDTVTGIQSPSDLLNIFFAVETGTTVNNQFVSDEYYMIMRITDNTDSSIYCSTYNFFEKYTLEIYLDEDNEVLSVTDVLVDNGGGSSSHILSSETNEYDPGRDLYYIDGTYASDSDAHDLLLENAWVIHDGAYYYLISSSTSSGTINYYLATFDKANSRIAVKTIPWRTSQQDFYYTSYSYYSLGGEANVIESISVNNVAQTVTNKNVNITVPTKVSDLTNDSGFTSNTGTITSVKMNGSTVASSGEADLGTVITSHQDISGKADKSEMSVVAGTGANADKTTITLKSGTSATVLTTHQDISGKADAANVLTTIGRTADYLTQTKNGTTSNVTKILERRGTYSQGIGAAGWYRVGRFIAKASGGASCVLLLSRSYSYQGNEAYVFGITLAYSGNISISQLAGDNSTQLIDKIRVEYLTNNDDFNPPIDIHVSSDTSGDNTYYVTILGGANVLSEFEKDPTLTGSTFEYSVNTGMGTATSSTDSTSVKTSNSNGSVAILAATNRGLYDNTGSAWIAGTDGTNTFLSKGNVGIGTTTPAYKLDVDGDASATTFHGALDGNATTATTLQTSRSIWGQSFNGSSYVRGTLSMFPDTLGMNNDTAKLWFRANTTDAGDGYSPYIQGIYQAGTGRKRLSVFQINNGSSYTGTHTEVFTILPDGKVGIGTNAPTAALEVTGDAVISGSLSLGGTTVAKVYSGSSAPSSGTGSDGDIYIQTTT